MEFFGDASGRVGDHVINADKVHGTGLGQFGVNSCMLFAERASAENGDAQFVSGLVRLMDRRHARRLPLRLDE